MAQCAIKPWKRLAACFFPLADQVILTAPRQARALTPDAMREIAAFRLTHGSRNRGGARDGAGCRPEDAIFITGSLFLVAEARALLLK